MNASSLSARLIGAAVLTFAASAAHAAFTFSTVSTSGNSNTAAQTYASSVSGASDAFSDLTINDPTPLGTAGVLNRTVYPGPATYTLSTETNLYSVQSPVIGGPAIAVDSYTDSLTFSNFGGVGSEGIRKFGASVYLSELTASNAIAGSFLVTAKDINGLTDSYTLAQGSSGNAATLYFTLASDVALDSIKFAVISPNTAATATVDNVVVGAVPLPAAGWLLISGLGGMGLFKRRRV